MTKAKAKTLVNALIEDGYQPTISVDEIDYTITILTPAGVTTTQVVAVENALTVTATLQRISFN